MGELLAETEGVWKGHGTGLGELPTCGGQTDHHVTSDMSAPCDGLAAQDMVRLLSLEAYEPLTEVKPQDR